MKAKNLLLLPLLSLFISCGSDFDDNIDSNPFTLSLEDGNYWVYNVQTDVNQSRDSLYVANDTVINSKTYKKFKTENPPTGFYSSALNNNGVIYNNGKMYLTGGLNLASNQNLPINLDVSVSDLVIFNKDAVNNQPLNVAPVTGDIQQTIQGYPIDIHYELNTYGGGTLATFTKPDDNEVYNNVKITRVTLDLTISTASLPISNFLTNPEVLVSNLYIAEGIGMIYSNTDISINLDSFVAGALGIPASSTQNQQEFLDSYMVGN